MLVADPQVTQAPKEGFDRQLMTPKITTPDDQVGGEPAVWGGRLSRGPDPVDRPHESRWPRLLLEAAMCQRDNGQVGTGPSMEA